MAKIFDDSDGVWRTIGGRRVFIRTGQSLASAMIESGKFKNLRSDYRKAKEEDEKSKNENIEKTEKNANELSKKESKNNVEQTYELDESKISDAYKTYREKRDKFEGIETDKLGNKNYDTLKDAKWTGKEYTTEEFLANLEDENWHTERKMILDAGLSKEQIDFIKDNTEFHNGSPSLDKEITEELIKGAKGEKYKTPSEILGDRRNTEISNLENELKDISQFGKYDEKGNYREGVKQDYKSYSEKKNRYKELTGNEFDDSNIKIPYDEKKTYEMPNGTKIDQKLMKEWYSGESPEKVKNDIEFEKSVLFDKSPANRERAYAQIKEMEKYYDSMEKYESRISDEFSVENWKEGYGNQFGEGSWKGSKSNSGLYGKDKIKAIDDEVKRAYPDLKTSRKTGRGGYTDSFSYNILESDKPIVRNIDDFSDSEIERLYNKGYNKDWYKTKEDFKDSIKRDLEKGHFSVNQYAIDDDYRLTPYGKQVFKDIAKVSNAYNYDESASQVDYFHTGHYLNLSVGKDGKPYKANGTTNNAIGKNKYETDYNFAKSRHIGFGSFNKDGIPVYDGKIDNKGDFGYAKLSTLNTKELQEAIKVQTEELNKAKSEKIGDQRTRNGRMDKIFNTAKVQKYEEGVKLLKEEAIKRENDKYSQYKGTDAEVKYYSAEDAMKDPNSKMNQYIKEQTQKKAYKKYLKLHPNSQMNYEEFKKNSK